VTRNDNVIDPNEDRDDRPLIRWSTLVTYPDNYPARIAGSTYRHHADTSRELAQVRYDSHTARGATCRIQRQEWRRTPWTDVDGPTITPTVYAVSRLPEDHPEYRLFTVTAEHTGAGWAVRHCGHALFTTGEWLPDRWPSSGVTAEEWWSMCRYPRDRALELAVEAADTVKVNGRTVADMLAGRWPGRERRTNDT
jgi:hypothetical protein